jgi:2-polyprenyl-3-methyl-5-hydroxy-6-metoxy-1,4-benzoquinol methylase
MWYIPIHISACADLMTFLFSHFKCVKITSFEGRDYIYLQKFKGYDKNKWHKLMKYWYKFDPEYGINYTNNKQNNIILQNMNIICAKPLTTKYHIFFDTVFEDEINWGDVIKFNKIITKNQKKKWAYYFKCQHNSNYLCKRYYDTYNKFLKLCRKKNIDINPVFLKYNINELFDKRVLKQYIFISTKYILFYDILNNIYNTDNDILYMYNSLSANMDKYNICFYNLKKHDIKYIIPVFKIFGDIEINIYNDNPIKRFQLVFKKYSKFNKVDKKYDIIVCRYDDYKYIKKYAKTIIFLENINKYKPLIRYDTYKKLSYTVVGYLSSTKTKYQIYECFKDNSSYKKLVVLLKKILRFTYIDKLKPFIESKSNDYIIYEFLYKHYKPIGRKSSGYMYSQYISSLVKDRKIETFMDFGAGSGIKTKAVKNILNLKDKNVYALDKKTFESVDNTKYEYNFNYVYYDGISYPDIDIKFDLITCIQVLHHIFEIEHTIKYLKSLLKKDGLLIIKEHKIDDNKNTSMLIDIEHSLYELGQNKNTKFLNTYYARYFSELEFLRLMTINGFIYVPIPEQVFDDNNPTNYIYYMFTV